MTPAEFAIWVATMKSSRSWSKGECARQLGCGINQILAWSKSPSPRYIELACMALNRNIGILTEEKTK